MVSMDVEAIAVIKKNRQKNNNTKGCVKAMEKLPQHILFVLFYRKTDCIFKGTDRGTDRAVFLDKREFTGPIYTQIKEAVDFVLRNIRLGATIDGLVRKEKYELPPEAIREILFLVCIRLSVVEMGLKSNT